MDRNKTLDMLGHKQENLSCYYHYKLAEDNNTLLRGGEGNCWMVSAYNVLQYVANNTWIDMPQWTDKDFDYSKNGVLYDPSKEELNVYSKYYDSNGKNKTKEIKYNNGLFFVNEYRLKSKKIYFPKLYTEVRHYINEKYKKVNGGTVQATSKIIEDIAKQYGYRVLAMCQNRWSNYLEIGTTLLDKNKPLLWSTSGNTYGNHTMAVCGYRCYSKVNGWWIFKWKSYKIFYELRDGHTSFPRYYDMSDHRGYGVIIMLLY